MRRRQSRDQASQRFPGLLLLRWCDEMNFVGSKVYNLYFLDLDRLGDARHSVPWRLCLTVSEVTAIFRDPDLRQ